MHFMIDLAFSFIIFAVFLENYMLIFSTNFYLCIFKNENFNNNYANNIMLSYGSCTILSFSSRLHLVNKSYVIQFYLWTKFWSPKSNLKCKESLGMTNVTMFIRFHSSLFIYMCILFKSFICYNKFFSHWILMVLS